jgi:Protein of unknown function (DUF2637)
MKKRLHVLADGILFQFVMVGSLSFSHIHDVVAAHGQAGWKSWLYPLSVDLLTVAAFRKIRVGQKGRLAWVAFLLGLTASLAANVIDSWTAAPAGRTLAVGIGVWPAVALLVCTLLSHDRAHETATVAPAATVAVAPARVAPATVARPTVAVAATSHTATRVATATVATPKPKPVAAKPTPTTQPPSRVAINPAVLDLIAEHGVDGVSGQMVADAIGAHKATGCRHLARVRKEIAEGKLALPAPVAATA